MNYESNAARRSLFLIPFVAFCLLSAEAQAQAAPLGKMPQSHMQAGKSGSEGMKESMMTGMDSMQKMSMSGDSDKDFAMMMKIHHQQALDMAQMELEHGKSPAMKTMAHKIIAAQKKEIAQFDQWLAKQK